MSRATVTSKGQITVPVEVRRDLGLTPGSTIEFVREVDGTYRITVSTRSLRDMKGALHRVGRSLSVEEMNDVIDQARHGVEPQS
jgi:AbrB family looped-hinge helix DNA binding protein